MLGLETLDRGFTSPYWMTYQQAKTLDAQVRKGETRLPREVGISNRPARINERVEIVIEKPLEGRLTEALNKAGVTGYTIVPVRGGSGRSGPWTREGQVQDDFFNH